MIQKSANEAHSSVSYHASLVARHCAAATPSLPLVGIPKHLQSTQLARPHACMGCGRAGRVADPRSFEKRAKVSGRPNRAVGVISGMITLGMSGV